MRAFSVDAAYQPFVEAQLRLILAEVKRDKDRREDEDERVQRLATVPEQFINRDATGRLTILVGAGNDNSATVSVLAVAGAIGR